MPRNVGKIAYRAEGIWWVAYFEQPNIEEGRIELGRIQLALVVDKDEAKEGFRKLIRESLNRVAPQLTVNRG